jgi:D-sedoheptulose 7-phosphate isomerase
VDSVFLSASQAAVIPDRRTLAREVVEQSAAAVVRCEALVDDVVSVADMISLRLASGGKVLICGNGGSAADAQHFAAELMGRFMKVRAPMAAIALTTDTSVLTAVANDYSYGEVFSRQVQALARAGDVLVGISTSGRSENVLRAFASAPAGVLKVALTGNNGVLGDMADAVLRAVGDTTAEIQAAHGVLIHAMCAVIESDVS